MHEKLKEQFHYYLDNQEEFVKQYNGKAIAIKDFEVIGVFDSESMAIEETQKRGYELGTFLVQRVSPGSEAYTVNIYTPYIVSI